MLLSYDSLARYISFNRSSRENIDEGESKKKWFGVCAKSICAVAIVLYLIALYVS